MVKHLTSIRLFTRPVEGTVSSLYKIITRDMARAGPVSAQAAPAGLARPAQARGWPEAWVAVEALGGPKPLVAGVLWARSVHFEPLVYTSGIKEIKVVSTMN